MSIAIKLLPFFLLGFLVWRMATATHRAKRALMRDSTPLNDWQILELVRDFARALDVDGFRVRILDMDQVNGVALPGGELFISRGLYEKFLGGEIGREEVGAVIAHEIGHVALGHHDRRIRAWRSETAALAVLWFLLLRMMLGVVGLLAVLGLNIYRNLMSQQDEFEADAFSAQLLRRAGHDPEAIVNLLDRLKGWNGGEQTAPTWLMSHPPLDQRIERLRAVIDAETLEAAAPEADARRDGLEL